LPLHHVGGFGVVARAFQAKCGLEQFNDRWDPMKFADWLKCRQVTHLSLVPTQVHDLVKAEICAPSSVKAIVVGGGHLENNVGQAARDLGWSVLASYGMTEAASQIATQRLDQISEPYQSSPIPLLPIWKTAVNDQGLLEISGPALFQGYMMLDAGRGFLYRHRDSDWFTASDRVLVDSNGITPIGRADSMVKILGELVDPESIERELVHLSNGKLAVGEFAVVAAPDDRAGHVLLVVFEESVDISIISDVLAIYHQSAPGFRRLQPPVVMGKLPKSALGKILRKELLLHFNR
jgi:o-succinylbenzoate---CoA ligase